MEKEQSDRQEDVTNVNPGITKQHSENPLDSIIVNKPVEQQPQDNSKNSAKYVVISIIIVALLIFGLVQYSNYTTSSRLESFREITGRSVKGLVEESYTFSGTEFKLINNLWYFTLHSKIKGQDYNIPLHFGPREVIDVPLTGKFDDRFTNDTHIYITFDPEEGSTKRQSFITLAAAELSFNLNQAINRRAVASCTNNRTMGCEDIDVVTCDNTDKAVIYLKYANETKVELKGNCAIVQGKEKDLTKAADRLLLFWYGILTH